MPRSWRLRGCLRRAETVTVTGRGDQVAGVERHAVENALGAAWDTVTAVADGLGDAGAARRARHVRIAAAAYSASHLVLAWRPTSLAALRASRACPHPAMDCGGVALETGDFIATLADEAVVH